MMQIMLLSLSNVQDIELILSSFDGWKKLACLSSLPSPYVSKLFCYNMYFHMKILDHLKWTILYILT
jgi:hypothetical protein